MSAHCSSLHSSTAFPTVHTSYCAADGSGLLILPLIDVYYPWTVRVSYTSADGSGLLILAHVNGFHSLCAVLHGKLQRTDHSSASRGLFSQAYSRTIFLSGCQRIAHSCRRQWLEPWFSHCITQQMVRQIAHSFTQQWFSRCCVHCIALRMVADCSHFRSSTAFSSVFAPYCRADGSRLLILLLVYNFHVVSYAILLCRWQWIAHTSARQRLSLWFACRMAPQMALDCSYLCSSMAFTTVCTLYCSVDGSGFLLLPVVNSFHHG